MAGSHQLPTTHPRSITHRFRITSTCHPRFGGCTQSIRQLTITIMKPTPIKVSFCNFQMVENLKYERIKILRKIAWLSRYLQIVAWQMQCSLSSRILWTNTQRKYSSNQKKRIATGSDFTTTSQSWRWTVRERESSRAQMKWCRWRLSAAKSIG